MAGLTLLRAIGARPAGLGEAFTAVPGDLQGLGFNPAGLAKLSAPSITAAFNRGLDDDSYGHVAYGHSVSFGSIFMGGAYYDAGDIDLDINGVAQGTRKAQQDMVGMAGLSIGRTSPVSFGLNAKFFKSELAEVATASALAVDGGILYQTSLEGLSLGAAVLNVGSDLKYEVESESLPQTARVGAAYDIDFQKFSRIKSVPYNLLLSVDGVKTKDEDSSVNSGFEIRRDLVIVEQGGYAALRGGYASGPKRGHIGVGFNVGNFLLDYAMGFSKEETLENINRVNIGWIFTTGKDNSPLDNNPGSRPSSPSKKRTIGNSPSR